MQNWERIPLALVFLKVPSPTVLLVAKYPANCYCSVRTQRWGVIIQAWWARQESMCWTGP